MPHWMDAEAVAKLEGTNSNNTITNTTHPPTTARSLLSSSDGTSIMVRPR